MRRENAKERHSMPAAGRAALAVVTAGLTAVSISRTFLPLIPGEMTEVYAAEQAGSSDQGTIRRLQRDTAGMVDRTQQTAVSYGLPAGADDVIYLAEKIPLEELLKSMPDHLVATYADGHTENVPVVWSCGEDYESSHLYYLEFDPSLENSSDSSQDLQDAGAPEGTLPYIGVSIENPEGSVSGTDSQVTTGQSGERYGDADGARAAGNEESLAAGKAFSIAPSYASANETAIYQFLHNDMGLNSAAAVGSLANIRAESSFNPQAESPADYDGLTSYGICQWHADRRNSLVSWCEDNGYDYASLEGQLHYLQYEAERKFPNTLGMVRSAANTADGAWQAAHDWCLYFERPAGGENTAGSRGNLARDTYFPNYYDGFWDVMDPSKYYYSPIYWARDAGVSSGQGNDANGHAQFGLGQACTRGEAVTFLYRAAGSPAVSGANPFTDLTKDWYRDAVEWAYETGITSGTSATTFGPDEVCTRAQIMTFLYRAKGNPAVSGTNSFADLSKDWYRDPIQWAYETGITSGTSETTFGPDDLCLREQILTFLYKAR